MKIKKFISIILIVVSLASLLSFSVNAGVDLTPVGFNNMVINTVAKTSNSKK